MSGRPTPETDAAWAAESGNGLNEVKEISRKLERERDEARVTIEDAKRALNATDYEGVLLAAMRVKEERDEAHKIAEQAIDDLAWLNETNAQRLRAELDQLKGGAK